MRKTDDAGCWNQNQYCSGLSVSLGVEEEEVVVLALSCLEEEEGEEVVEEVVAGLILLWCRSLSCGRGFHRLALPVTQSPGRRKKKIKFTRTMNDSPSRQLGLDSQMDCRKFSLFIPRIYICSRPGFADLHLNTFY